MFERMVASLGAFGESLNHAERDVHRWTRNLYDSKLEKYHFKLDVPWVLNRFRYLQMLGALHHTILECLHLPRGLIMLVCVYVL